MPTQGQYDTTLQSYREINILVNVMDYNMVILDEISGLTTQSSISIDSDSDIRRTANITMVLKNDFVQLDNTASSVQNFYWQAGNPYWYDKLIQIQVGITNVFSGEIEWINQGVYLVNAPSITYDASTNSLSFQAVDLMCKMTGLRNGQLENIDYVIPFGSSITGAIESVLLEQGFTQYILYDPPINTTPYEIKIDAGGTSYDLLAELRDINANWEMFFDIDGVFIFQQIPSGKVIIDPTTGEEGEPVPVVDDIVWNKLLIDYSLNTSFQEVKNYIEVYGKTIEPDVWGTGMVGGTEIIRVEVEQSFPSLYEKYKELGEVIIGFGVDIDDNSSEPVTIDHDNTKNISLVFQDGHEFFINTGKDGKGFVIKYLNYYYCVAVRLDESDVSGYYMGYLQPVGVAFESNPDSPFYVGSVSETSYICSTGAKVSIVPENSSSLGFIPFSNVSGDTVDLDVKLYLSLTAFNAAPNGTEWSFTSELMEHDSDIIVVNVVFDRTTILTDKLKDINNPTIDISLDFNQRYLIKIVKVNNNTINCYGGYYPISASYFQSPTDQIYSLPKFPMAVRYVCSGDEYDNIYTNDLAKQRANYELYLRSRLHDDISIRCVPIYWLDVNQIISYTLPQEDTLSYWLVKSISTDISANGTQTIQAIRYYPLYPSN